MMEAKESRKKGVNKVGGCKGNRKAGKKVAREKIGVGNS